MKRLIFTALALLFTLHASAVTEVRVAVLPVEFQDADFRDIRTGVQKKAARACDYFNDQFTGSRSFSFEVLPVVRVARPCAWYGANSTDSKDRNIDALVRDACSLTTSDMSGFDCDGDGRIDNLCIITAGGNEAAGDGPDCIWPRHGLLSAMGGTAVCGGRTVDSFTICPESAGLGVFCHEYAHSLGLPDLYDTDGAGSGGVSKGLWGSLSLMDKGLENDGGETPPNFCAIEMELLGTGKAIQAAVGEFTLHPLSRSREYLRINAGEGEYYLLECRDNNGWDSATGGCGLLAYRIDKSEANFSYSEQYGRDISSAQRWADNQINCRPDHQCASLTEASPNASDVAEVFFPYDDARAMGFGPDCSLAIDNISLQSDGSVRFSVIIPVTLYESVVFQDAAILNWTTDKALDVSSCEISWYPEGREETALRAEVTESLYGNFHITLEQLFPDTVYTLVFKVLCKNGTVHSKTGSIRTKSVREGVRPFIYLNSLHRDANGNFLSGEKLPLRVYNAVGATKVEWYFNERPILPDNEGFWRIAYGGTLKAVVWYWNGTRDIIIKAMAVQ